MAVLGGRLARRRREKQRHKRTVGVVEDMMMTQRRYKGRSTTVVMAVGVVMTMIKTGATEESVMMTHHTK
jgi:hypothetical protein